MDEGAYLSWDEGGGEVVVQEEEVICGLNNEQIENMISEDSIVYTDDVCEEVVIEEDESPDGQHLTHAVDESGNVIYYSEEMLVLPADGQAAAEGEPYMEDCQVSEEVIESGEWTTDCPELVIGSVEQVGDDSAQPQQEDDVMIPLPTDQDQYLASRPYPCDFCSRRFRKKANLMNHMVAHQTDRPHGCNLCGVRYIRKCDLMNHLKIHAYIPDTEEQIGDDDDAGIDHLLDDEDDEEEVQRITRPGRRGRPPAQKFQLPPQLAYGKNYRRKRIKNEYSNQHDYMSQAEGETTTYFNYEQSGGPSGISPHEDVGGGGESSAPVQQHYPITDARRPFVCQQCGVAFAREKALESHMRIHAAECSAFECRVCTDVYWDRESLRDHMNSMHTADEVHASMMQQQDDADDGDAMVMEENLSGDEYSDDQYGEFFCNECGESFSRPQHLKKHMRTHIKGPDLMRNQYEDYKEFKGNNMHICNQCGEQFSEALDLLAHAECHARAEPRCNVCGATFRSQEEVANHVSTRHGDSLPPHSCLLCGRTCRDNRALLKHNLEHTREKEFQCPKCFKAFHNRARLKRHLLSHRDKAVTCDVCSQSFPDGRSLMNHRHSHSSVSGRQFPCDECGKSFGSRSSQQIHVRIHTGERPYGCRFCWKAFADGGTLRKHERIHTGEKPYACAVCPRAFNQRVVLREHIRSHHSGPDPNHSHSNTPFCCSVCADLFATSQDLIVHLIHHCDLNTAMRRQPQVGPRKYKRRRKLKAHEIGRDSPEIRMYAPYDDDDVPATRGRGRPPQQPQRPPPPLQRRRSPPDFAVGSETDDVPDEHMDQTIAESPTSQSTSVTVSTPRKRGRQPRGTYTKQQTKLTPKHELLAESEDQSPSQTMSESYNVFKTFKSSLDNAAANSSAASSMAMKPPKLKKRSKDMAVSSRPKMIHTQKTRVAVETNEGGKVRHKTRTLVTRTQAPPQFPGAVVEPPKSPTRQQQVRSIRPRARNVYHRHSIDDDSKKILPDADMSQVEQAVSSILDTEPITTEEVITSDMIEDTEDAWELPPQSNVKVERHEPPQDDGPVTSSAAVSITNGMGLRRNEPRTRQSVSPRAKIVKIVKGGMIVSNRNRPVVSPKKSKPKFEEIYVDQPQLIMVKQEAHEEIISEDNPLNELAEISMQHAGSSVFRCEMCSAVFGDRNALLEHVAIHI